MRWSVLKEGLRGVAVPNGLGTPDSGDEGRLSRTACGGQQFPRPGQTSLGYAESCPGGGWCSSTACGG